MSAATEAVERGAAYLDATYGTDWPARVGLTTLDLTHPDWCPLGQASGAYWPAATEGIAAALNQPAPEVHDTYSALRWLDFHSDAYLEWTRARGFYYRDADECRELSAAWRALIATRIVRPVRTNTDTTRSHP